MSTTSQPIQTQNAQTTEDLDLEIIDLPGMSETGNNPHAWIQQKVLQWQRSIQLRSWRRIRAFSTLLLAFIASFVILSSTLSSVTSSPVITPHPHISSASSNTINY